MSSGGSSRYWRSNHEMLSRKGNRSGMEISTAGPERMGDMVSGCPQLQLRRQPPAELGGVEEEARIVRRGEEGRAQAVLCQEREEVVEQLVQGEGRGLGALPGAAGAGAGELRVGPEGEGVRRSGHHLALLVLERPGLLPVGDELHELDGPVRGRQGLERAQLVLPGLPAHRASASSPSVRAPTVTGSGSSASSPSSSAASARFRSPRIQSESVCISLASREMPALSQRLTTLRKKQEASSSGSSGPFWPKRWPPKVMPRRMKLTLARAMGEPSSMHRSRTAFEVRVRK